MSKWIPGFEGKYMATDDGHIYSSLSQKVLVECLHGGRKLEDGTRIHQRLFVTIGRKQIGVHVLVALAFIGPKPKGMVVKHGLGGPFNNKPGNLSYGTQKENIEEAIDAGTIKHKYNKKQLLSAIALVKDKRKGIRDIAKQTGVYVGTVSAIYVLVKEGLL